ncbi:MAG: site-specific DNA-methyltransferase [Bacteroidaceae bacterium]|nr:site-specific DNA-methyltransferase [Bacteroidaceae bacterium]
MIELHKGDCLEVMKQIPDKSVDMILCDLPYGLTNNSKDIIIPFEDLWQHYTRIIKDNGAICLFAQGLFYVDLINSNRKLFRYDLVWDKVLTSGFLNAKRMPLRQHEQIAIFYKKLPVYNPQFTVGKPLHSKGTSYLNKEHVNQNYGKFHMADDSRKGSTDKYPTSIIRFQKPHPSIAQHRTEKSIECLEWLIKTYTNENETILDNCMGSGSTGVACQNTNRNFIGIELDDKYFDIAKKRINGKLV